MPVVRVDRPHRQQPAAQEAPVEHVVFFTAPDGATAFRRVDGLEDAVRLVEHLRNVEGVHQVSVHPLGEEVPLAFRTWYRVEVPAGAAPVVPQQAVAEEASSPSVEVPGLEVAPVPVLADEAPVVAEPVVDEVVEPAAEPVVEAAVDQAVEPVAEAEPAYEPAPELAPEPVPAAAGPRDDLKSLGFFAT